jgi:D-alanyl-D-alanine carboxypeptidase (penicillin-binding protein 5/6)
VDGLKTGFTNGAGFCLSTTAMRNGRRIIVVMMDSPDSRTRDLHVRDLINRGFAALPMGGPAFAAATDQAAPPSGPVPVRAAGATPGANSGATPGTNAGMTARVASMGDPAAGASAGSAARPAAGSAAAPAPAPVIRYPGPGGY